jgi:hypothetical protein
MACPKIKLKIIANGSPDEGYRPRAFHDKIIPHENTDQIAL